MSYTSQATPPCSRRCKHAQVKNIPMRATSMYEVCIYLPMTDLKIDYYAQPPSPLILPTTQDGNHVFTKLLSSTQHKQ